MRDHEKLTQLPIKDLSGQKFGRLTVLEYSESKYYTQKNGKNKGQVKRCIIWKCQCDCGNITSTWGSALKSGGSTSCGCFKRENNSKNSKLIITHGKSAHPLYHVWRGIKVRCFKKKSQNYKSWGGRGITMCDEWRNDFRAFYDWGIANGYEHKKNKKRNNLTIDRINNDGNYEPSNCKWSTYIEQSRNRRNNIWIEYGGERKLVSEWAKELSITQANLSIKIKKTSINDAFYNLLLKKSINENGLGKN